MFNKSIGIDLGTSTVLVYVPGKGIVLEEPSAVAVDKAQDKVIAAGIEAEAMLGRTPPQIEACHPVRGGVISSYTMADKMLASLFADIKKYVGTSPDVMMCVPSGVTDVELRSVIEAARGIGADNIYIIDEVMAAAIGAGIDIIAPKGSMIVDIGGGTTDIAVICAGHIISGRSIKIAGDEFTDAIVRYVRHKYNLSIGESTAELVKKTIGTIGETSKDCAMMVKGLSTVSGLPEAVLVSQEELKPVLEEVAHNITERVREVLEDVSARLQGDILESGITLVGGASLLAGLAERIESITGVKTVIAENPTSCVAKGAGKALLLSSQHEPTFGKFYKKAYIYK